MLRLTASDTALSAFAETTVTVNAVVPVNLAPIVAAGANQTITLPAGATLAGTVTDDGLPQGATVTSQWTRQSGPGSVTFANAANTATTASFSVAGTYVLRLTATDTLLTAFADVTIVVNPASVNTAPQVSAGPNQTTTLPGSASLFGSVVDDGLPQGAAVTVQWSQQSGPGTTSVANPGSPSTTATFSAPGVYVLRLTANDGAASAFAETTITVNPRPVVNQPPTVNAGDSRTITLPAGTTLAGTVTDDGLPQGAAVTSQWTQQSGPGTTTFANPANASTTATFSVAGTYVLRLTASDTALTAFADVTVTVNPVPPVNQPPVVTAGTDITLTLPSSATLAGTVTDDGLPQGSTLTTLWAQQSGPGSTTFADATAPATTATFSTAGDYVLGVTASDTDKTVSATVTVHALAPAVTNRTPVVDAGPDVQVGFGTSARLQGSATDDGLPTPQFTTTWRKLSGPGVVSFVSATSTVTDATFTAPGVYVLALTANDTLLGATDDMVVTVAPPAGPTDRAPPVLTLNVPASALPGATVTALVIATDDTGVLDVAVDVDGDTPVAVSAPPYTRTFTVPQLVAPGQSIQVRAVARDAALNGAASTATITIGTVPDTTSPNVQVFGPATTTPGASIALTAQATDLVGVQSVAFLINDAAIGVVQTPPYLIAYAVPANAPAGTPLAATARATDFAGNYADSTIQIDVTAQSQATPPVVTLTVPADALPGEVITLDTQVTDATGVASVAFTQGTAVLQTLQSTPFSITYTIPIQSQPGDAIDLTAEATNFANLKARVTKTVRVKAATQITLGVVTGEVYDDTTSLPLAGVTVDLTGVDAQGAAYTDTTQSDARGRFVLRGNAGSAVVRIRYTFWTGADRPITILGGQAVELLDARLTPLALEQQVSAATGATLALAGGSVTIPAGSLAQGGPMRFAPLSQQGLQGRAPLGWAPVGAADVWPHGTALGSPALLRLRKLAPVSAGQPIVVAQWDEAAPGWRATGVGAVSSDGLSVEGATGVTGQVAFLVA
ncbi:MAG: Ig-like domain-containing protein, partial [Vicinamibacterales bacterium]